MRLFFLIFSLVIFEEALSQINFGFSKNIDFYKPYTQETQDYLKINDKVSSSTYNYFIAYKIKANSKYTWSTGIAIKHIEQIVEEKIKSYYETDYGNGGTQYLVYEDLDLKNKSNSLAILNDFSLNLKEKLVVKHELGVINEIYFLEKYRSSYFYSNSNKKFEHNDVHIYPLQPGFFKFFLSSINLATFYRFTYKVSDKFSLATKISLGTNLYSDWDQFKKYAWLGVGLELGFGKRKTPKPVAEQ